MHQYIIPPPIFGLFKFTYTLVSRHPCLLSLDVNDFCMAVMLDRFMNTIASCAKIFP
jgi:hypothetical protein